jgi:hypothetical protein
VSKFLFHRVLFFKMVRQLNTETINHDVAICLFHVANPIFKYQIHAMRVDDVLKVNRSSLNKQVLQR